MTKDILAENDRYRVYLQFDEYADAPYDDGQPPTMRLGERYLDPEHIYLPSSRPTDDDDAIEHAIEHWHVRPYGDSWKLFVKYLRAYYGTVKISTYQDRQGEWYVAYDTAAWREYVGFPADEPLPEAYLSGNFLEEWEAYCNGECYIYVVERKRTGVKVYKGEPLGTEVAFEEWEHIDACGGFYGEDYAREEALAAYNYQVEHDSKES